MSILDIDTPFLHAAGQAGEGITGSDSLSCFVAGFEFALEVHSIVILKARAVLKTRIRTAFTYRVERR
jgi:hypothetical protein